MKHYIHILLFLFLPLAAVAQNDHASVDTSLTHTHGMTGFSPFNPAAYQVQKRWRPTEGDTAFQQPWWRHLTLGVSTGVDFMTNWHYNTRQIPLQAFIGYNITPIHQLRLQLGTEEMEVQGQSGRLTTGSAEIQYLANLNAFTSGYNPNRPLQFSTLLSIGAKRYHTPIPYRITPFARVGFDVAAHIGPNLSIFAQPYVGAIRNTDGAFTTHDPAHYKVIYGVHGGLAAHFTDSRQFYADKAPIYRNVFFETGVGMGFESRAFNTHQGGMNAWVGLGRWFDPAIGLRLGVMGQQNYWDSTPYATNAPSYKLNKAQAAAAVRGELLINLMNLSGKNRNSTDDPKWEVDLSAGAHYGHNARTDEPRQDNTWRCNYYGFTGAIQALYKVAPGSYLYIEPRFYNNIYNQSYVHEVGDDPIKIDRFMTFNAGVRIYAAPHDIRANNDNVFHPHWWTGLGFGGMRIFQHYRVQEKGYGALQPTVSLNVGYDAHPLATLRLQSEWQMLKRNTGNLNTNYQMIDFRLMYMLPFTNLIRGVDSKNKLQTYIELGPTLSSFVGQHTKYGPGELGNGSAPVYRVGQHSLGGMVGIMAAYKVAPRWDVYIESQGQYTMSDNFTAGNDRRPGHLKYGLYGGLRYHFLPHGEEERASLALDVPDWQKGWFVEGSAGWAFPMRGSHNDIRQDGTALHRSGSLFNLNFGRMFMPWLGARIGLAAQQNSGHTSKAVVAGRDFTSYAAMASASMTLEALIDPLCFSRNIRQQDNRWFDLNLSAGFSAGAIYASVDEDHRGRTKHVGFVSTMQTLFRVAPSVWLYAEPRFTTAHYNPHKLGAENYVYPRAAVRSMAISGGVRILRPGKSTFDKGGIIDDYSSLRAVDSEAPLLAHDGISTAFQPHWWFGVQAGGTKDVNDNKWVAKDRHIPIQPTMSLNAGYDIHPLATLRAQMEYTRLGNLSLPNLDEHHDDMLTMRLMYMLNMTNLWRGTRQWTKLSLYPEVGLAFGHHNATNNTKREAFGLAAGAMAALRLSSQVDLTVETIQQYNWPHGYMPAQDHPKMGNGTWSLTVGSRYHILPDREDRIAANAEIPEWQRGWFFDFGTGWSLPVGKNVDAEGNSGGTMIERSGSIYNLTFGRWLTPWLGARAGLMAQQHYGPTRNNTLTLPGGITRDYTTNEAQAFGAMSFEVLTSPLNYSRHIREMENRWFDLNLAVGPYWGAVAREMGGGSHHREKMIGFTGSMQALFRVNNGTQLYIEPRYMATRYSNRDVETAVKPYTIDRTFNVSLGVRVTRPDYDTRKAEAEAEANSLHDETVPSIFRPNLWLGLGLGGVKDVDSHKILPRTGLSIHPAASISLGYDLHPLATLRAQFEYAHFGRMSNNLEAVKNNSFDFRFLYMLNATNLWRGTRIWPRFSVLPEVGIAYSHHSKVAGYESNTAGLVAGTMVAWRATRTWDITAETQGQYALNTNFMPWQETTSRGGRGKWGIGIGTRYHFGDVTAAQSSLNLFTPGAMTGWFVEGGYGWNMPLCTGQDALALSGSSWNVNFGHWFSSTLGFRAGLTATQGYWDKHHTDAVMKSGQSIHGAYDTKHANITNGARLELMTNPLNYFYSIRHRLAPTRFDLNLSAGFEIGRSFKTHIEEGGSARKYTGFTAAAQMLYRVGPGMQIFLEPRYHSTHYTLPENALGIKEKTTDHYMTLAVGARIQRPNAQYRSYTKDNLDRIAFGEAGSHIDNSFTPHWFFGVNVGGVKQLHCAHVTTGGLGWQPGFGLNLGYVAHPLATARLQLELDAASIVNLSESYQTQVSYKKWETRTAAMKDKLTLVNARAIYMLDFTNLWRGTRQQPRLSAYWEVGPTVATILGQSKSFLEGEQIPSGQMTTGMNYKGRSSFGVMTGILCAIRLNPQWDLTIESMGQYNFKRDFLPSNCRNRYGNTLMEFSVGTRYNF